MSGVECPARFSAPIREQLGALVVTFLDVLESRLTGIYLHGSLAMGCFNSDLSDIDLLIRVRDPLDQRTRRRIVSLLLDLSGNPSPIELSILSDADLFPWCYPTPYTLHFSEDWRQRFEAGEDQPAERLDPDLAAHITVLRARGVALLGPPVSEVFPQVPEADYLDSILRDYEWARARLHQNPVYAVLNMARVLRYLTDGMIVSKLEAGVWALDVLPQDVQPLVLAAVRYYQGECDRFDAAKEDIERYTSEVEKRLANDRS
jgi:predicted nucleotidyltransferase